MHLFTPLAKRDGLFKRMESGTTHPEIGGHLGDIKCPFRYFPHTGPLVGKILKSDDSIDMYAKFQRFVLFWQIIDPYPLHH